MLVANSSFAALELPPMLSCRSVVYIERLRHPVRLRRLNGPGSRVHLPRPECGAGSALVRPALVTGGNVPEVGLWSGLIGRIWAWKGSAIGRTWPLRTPSCLLA